MWQAGLVTSRVRVPITQAYAGHRLIRWLLICVVSVVSARSAGCVPAVQYQPNAGVVDTLGVPQA